MTATEEGPRRPRRRAPRRPGLVAACLLLSAVAASLWWGGALLVLDGSVLPAWTVGAGSLVVALVLGLARPPRVRLGRGWLWGPLTALAAGTALLGAAGDVVYGARYEVLGPVGPAGCRVVVRETSFLMAGRGSVHVVSGAWGLARRVGSYDVDDGYRPVEADAYRLRWRGGDGTLEISEAFPDVPAPHC